MIDEIVITKEGGMLYLEIYYDNGKVSSDRSPTSESETVAQAIQRIADHFGIGETQVIFS